MRKKAWSRSHDPVRKAHDYDHHAPPALDERKEQVADGMRWFFLYCDSLMVYLMRKRVVRAYTILIWTTPDHETLACLFSAGNYDDHPCPSGNWTPILYNARPDVQSRYY
jgi:hypothetical protein